MEQQCLCGQVEKDLRQYIDALEYILKNGKDREDRTGTGTKGVFGYQMRFDLCNEFPAVTTKKLAWRAVVGELLWMLEGSSDERWLAEITFERPKEELTDKTTIWTANADNQAKSLGYTNTDTEKDLGPVYGHQWRSWDAQLGYVDQIAQVLESLKFDPNSRRHIVSSWNADRINVMALPPCHTLFQFHIQDSELSCQLYQRSADMFLGVPFNIASYSLLTHMFAQLLNLKVGEFAWTGGDCHIYQNHMQQVREQITREPRKGPTLQMPAFTNLEELTQTKPSEYKLVGYDPQPSIKAPMAV
jgi:thymidylate synthase